MYLERWLERPNDPVLDNPDNNEDGEEYTVMIPHDNPIDDTAWRRRHEIACPCLAGPVPCTCAGSPYDASFE